MNFQLKMAVHPQYELTLLEGLYGYLCDSLTHSLAMAAAHGAAGDACPTRGLALPTPLRPTTPPRLAPPHPAPVFTPPPGAAYIGIIGGIMRALAGV